jgi:hypothetical protein
MTGVVASPWALMSAQLTLTATDGQAAAGTPAATIATAPARLSA